ncbi:MAG: asparagine synthase (glutamine-hydrolyzing) [Candidatus Methanomethylicaceae archaeon]
MCGIAGLLRFDGAKVNQETFYRAVECIRHRGPDDEGYVILETRTGHFEERGGTDSLPELGLKDIRAPTVMNADLVMANRRLAIIDLSPKGHQPKHNEDFSIWLVFNGEVYNYRELREELFKSQHEFTSDTDTEVVVHGYEEWGLDLLLSKMVGMWGFALWDQRKKKLYLVRDRFGIKPLYYHLESRSLMFASEIKAIRSIFRTKVNEKRIAEFLWFMPYNPEETFFEGLNQVLPAHYIEVEPLSGKIEKVKYWDIKEVNLSYGDVDYKKCVKEFYENLERSLKYHMVSDVPIGTCLSGGLDSSTIVCLAQKLLDEGKISEKGLFGIKKLKTFSSIPKEKRVSEAFYIDQVIKKSEVEGFSVSPTFENFIKDFEKVVKIHDEPFQGPSVYMQYRVMELAKSQNIKVLLDGQGADELLGGYHSYIKLYLRDLLKENPLKFFKEFIKTRDLVTPLMWQFVREKMGIKKSLISKTLKTKPPTISLQNKNEALAEKLRYDLFEGRLIELLKYEDINSMVFSIESRVPFLYHPLVEYLFKQPVSLRIRDGWTKYILRESMKGILPEVVRKRRSKLGFSAPDAEWAKRLIQERFDWVRSIISHSEKFINYNGFEKLCKRILQKGWREDVLFFWRIIILSKWVELLEKSEDCLDRKFYT